MRLPDEFDDHSKMGAGAVRMILGATLFMAAVLVVVLVLNQRDNNRSQRPVSVETSTETGEETQELVQGSLSPEDLDFWDLYPPETEETLPEDAAKEETTPENDPSTDGKHTLVIGADGKEEWVLISPYLPKHEYDFTRLVCQSDIMKYYVDGKQVSYVGVEISKYQDYVDFVKVKKAGIDFVMLRVGVRGYGTGQLMLDEYFQDNLKRASDAGLQVGLYFFSQAITEAEAEEEANLVLANIGDYKISYPIAFDMELIPNDTSRIEELTREDRTNIAKKFLTTIENAGYKPMLYGNKEWLIRRVDLSRLTDYDVWLSQPGDLPDYPYKFTMWEYSDTVTVDGIVGYSSMTISFIDYSEK